MPSVSLGQTSHFRLWAQSGHGTMSDLSPLSGEERKSHFGAVRSVDDPSRPSLIQEIHALHGICGVLTWKPNAKDHTICGIAGWVS